MKEDMKVFYNETLERFSTTSEKDCIEIFETHQKEGWANGLKAIKQGIYRIEIQTNFYPKAVNREYIYVDIYINDVLLLPLSLACRKAAVLYHFSEEQIAFQQWKKHGKRPHTIIQTRGEINWQRLLEQICNICNNYKSWIVSETHKLIKSLVVHNRLKFWDIAIFIELVRRYDIIEPELIPVYRDFIDGYVLRAMSNLIEYIGDHNMKEIDTSSKAIYGDILWNYIKEYNLNYKDSK